jgi:hypothetical protein
MLEKRDTSGRERFYFSEAVFESFRFLVQKYGFSVVKHDATLVRFESEVVFVNVYHGRGSYELGVEIGELRTNGNIPEFGYTLREIILLSDVAIGSNFRPYQIDKPELVKAYVAATADLVEKYAHLALIGDPDVFDKLSDAQLNKSNEYLKSIELGKVRTDGDLAWREKNYERLVELYEGVKEDLTPAEIKKLEYSRRKLKKN